MSDKTSTPDEPRDRGPVSTGEHQAVVPEQAAPEKVAPEGAASPRGGSAGGGGGPADAPTAHLQAPSANGVPSRPSPGARADGPAPTAPGPSGGVGQGGPRAPSMQSPTPPAPSPSPGPVPGPGPAAAAPPPWHRVPGQDPEHPVREERPHRPAGGLLEEEPTAFLTAPARPGTTPPQAGEPTTEGGGWSAVRAVRNRPPRQAALQLKRLDPWSVLKLALVLAVVLFFIWLVAAGVLYAVLNGMGVWDQLNGTYADLVSGETPTGAPLISAGRVLGVAAVVGAINSLLFAVALTIGAFVYNVSADLVGGIEVTLSERD